MDVKCLNKKLIYLELIRKSNNDFNLISHELCIFDTLYYDFVEQYNDMLNWTNISYMIINSYIPGINYSLDMKIIKFIKKFKKMIDWNLLSKHIKFDQLFLKKFKHEIKWDIFYKNQPIPPYVFDKYKRFLNFDDLNDYQNYKK